MSGANPPAELVETISKNLAAVRGRIERACERASRDPAGVTLVCVSKLVEEERIRAAHAAGARDFGENYGQELRDKTRALADLEGVRWHFIGPLQKNKIRYAVGHAALIHSVHAASLVEEIERRAQADKVDQEVLVQLNLSGEETKSGIAGEELAALLDAFAPCVRTRCVGLMTMPPFFDEPDRARPLFASLRALAAAARAVPRARVELRHLSMGMSGDFEVAIEEGATLVRVGTAIFGARR
jgi:PLP dependent protein